MVDIGATPALPPPSRRKRTLASYEAFKSLSFLQTKLTRKRRRGKRTLLLHAFDQIKQEPDTGY